MTELENISVFSNNLQSHKDWLKHLRGKQFTGVIQKTIPKLDDATMGLQAMNCIAGGPASGKTTFVQQICMDALFADTDVCCLFVSLEMSEQALFARWSSRLLHIPYRKLLTENTDDILAEVDYLMAPIAGRLAVLEAVTNAEHVVKAVKLLKKVTGCKRIIVAIDYFQLFPMLSSTPLEEDEHRVLAMKQIRDAIYPDPLLIISEINKTDNFKAEGLHSIKGSARIAFAADTAILLNPIDDSEVAKLTSNVYTSAKGEQSKTFSKVNPALLKDEKREEREQRVENLREDMRISATDFIRVNICKARAPGETAKFIIQHKYRLSDMQAFDADYPAASPDFYELAKNMKSESQELEELFA